jgi:hypothetical protein
VIIYFTFEGLATGRPEKILFVTVVRDMSHALPLDLAQRVDTELAMLSFEVTVVIRFMWRVVDMTDDLFTLREDRSVFS